MPPSSPLEPDTPTRLRRWGRRISRGVDAIGERLGITMRDHAPREPRRHQLPRTEWHSETHLVGEIWVRHHVRPARRHASAPHSTGAEQAPGSPRTTVVFVHGLGMAARSFLPLTAEFRDEFDVVLIDLPGFAGLPHPPEPLRMEQFAEAVVGVCRRLAITDVTLVGHSMGCQVASLAAQQLDCRAVVLLAPPDTRAPLPLTAWRFARTVLHEPWIARRKAVGNYLWGGVHWALEVLPLMLEHRTREALRDVHDPVMVVRGEHDWVSPAAWADELWHTCGATERVVDDGAHSMIFDRVGALTIHLHDAVR
ncbi:alpha/beta fold hydrolase [Parenemella sanctibonifatiensis]|uniref:alpha/beta fold hydrolase n=1 Tax=Parenemella sanctibonifatiensis TaxID=2016505 RepID=UPI0015C5B185|nr:alpha/beta fold hydrolase [Parenemella sanctibonifatiensis]